MVTLFVQVPVLEKPNGSFVVAPWMRAVRLGPSIGMSTRHGLTWKLGSGMSLFTVTRFNEKLAAICALPLVRFRMVSNGWLFSGLMNWIGSTVPLAAM